MKESEIWISIDQYDQDIKVAQQKVETVKNREIEAKNREIEKLTVENQKIEYYQQKCALLGIPESDLESDILPKFKLVFERYGLEPSVESARKIKAMRDASPTRK